MSTPPPASPTDSERDAARKRIKARRDFWQMLAVFVVISIVLIVIWWVSGADHYFWPVWPLIGFAIATVFSGLSAFGITNREVTDSDIDAELQKRNAPRS